MATIKEMTKQVTEHLNRTAQKDYEYRGDPANKVVRYGINRGTITEILKLKKQIGQKDFEQVIQGLSKRFKVIKGAGGYYSLTVFIDAKDRPAWTKVQKATV